MTKENLKQLLEENENVLFLMEESYKNHGENNINQLASGLKNVIKNQNEIINFLIKLNGE